MDRNHTVEVKPASTLAERAAEIRLMHKEHIRTTLEQARDMGTKLREAKAQCVRENKPWLPWLEEAKVNRVTAWKYMRIAEKWSLLVDFVSLAKHGGVEDAIKWLAGGEEEEKEIYSQQTAPPKSNNPAAGLAPPPPEAAIKCRDCARKGRSGIGCDACKALNSGKKPSAPKPPPPQPDREPGSDDDEVDKAYERYEEARLKSVSGPLIREIRKIAASYGLQAPPPKKRFEPSQPFDDWFDGFDPRFKEVMRGLWSARAKLRDLLRRLEEERIGKGNDDAADLL